MMDKAIEVHREYYSEEKSKLKDYSMVKLEEKI